MERIPFLYMSCHFLLSFCRSSKSIFDFASSIGDVEAGYLPGQPCRCSLTSRQSVTSSVSVTAERSIAQLSMIIKEKLKEHFQCVEKVLYVFVSFQL